MTHLKRQLARATCIVALTSLAGLGAAAAADLSPRMYTKAPPPMPVLYNWTGFYIGANVGGSWGHQDTTFSTAAGTLTNSNHIDGVIGGGQIGYNWQAGSPWVFGIEADIQGSGERHSGAFLIPGVGVPASTLSYEDKLDWFGTVRGRIGYAIGDQGRVLPYVTGGLAYGERDINGTASIAGVGATFDNSKTDVGWTVGAGIEWAVWDRWSLKFEYLYADLGSGSSVTFPGGATLSTGHFRDNIARVGVNLHF